LEKEEVLEAISVEYSDSIKRVDVEKLAEFLAENLDD